MRRSLWVTCVALTACAPPPAPEELSDLSRYLYQAWDSEDPRVQANGLQNLNTFLQGSGLSPEQGLGERSWTVDLLKPDDVAAIDRPDRPLSDCIGVSVAFASRWPVGDHAKLQAEVDQLPAEPTAETYVRSFPEAQAACFPDQSCDVMVTVNDARRANIFIAADFILYKNFRWVPFEDDEGVERMGFYSRSWFAESWPGDGGRGTLWQSYSIDVWIEQPDGNAFRYQTLWSETELALAGVTEDIVKGTVTSGTDGAMNAGDNAIGVQYHGEEPQ